LEESANTNLIEKITHEEICEIKGK